MTEAPLKRFFIVVNMKANTYTVMDRQTGGAVMTGRDPVTASDACLAANERHERDQALLDALARASGRPQ